MALGKKIESGSQIKGCNCRSAYQDMIYGRGLRLHNITADGSARCTCCSTKKERSFAKKA